MHGGPPYYDALAPQIVSCLTHAFLAPPVFLLSLSFMVSLQLYVVGFIIYLFMSFKVSLLEVWS